MERKPIKKQKVKWKAPLSGKTYDVIIHTIRVRDKVAKIVPDFSSTKTMPFPYFWVDFSEIIYNDSFSFIGIAKKIKVKQMEETKKTIKFTREERVKIVNEIIKEIAGRGRKFFYHDGKIAELVDKGRIYYKAEYGNKPLMCLSIPDTRQPKGWFHGGTLMRLTREFRDFIKNGKRREGSGLYSPHWGYPTEDMKEIRKLAIQLNYLIEPKN